MPTPNEHPAVWPEVIKGTTEAVARAMAERDWALADRLANVAIDMQARDRIGSERYGTPLQPFNGRDCLRDLYEEFLDASAYAMQAKMEGFGEVDDYEFIGLIISWCAELRGFMDEREAAHD